MGVIKEQVGVGHLAQGWNNVIEPKTFELRVKPMNRYTTEWYHNVSSFGK